MALTDLAISVCYSCSWLLFWPDFILTSLRTDVIIISWVLSRPSCLLPLYLAVWLVLSANGIRSAPRRTSDVSHITGLSSGGWHKGGEKKDFCSAERGMKHVLMVYSAWLESWPSLKTSQAASTGGNVPLIRSRSGRHFRDTIHRLDGPAELLKQGWRITAKSEPEAETVQ